MAKNKNFKVIKDTREQEGYYFSEYGTCLGMVERKLDTGDYSIEGLEDLICIERKGCAEELAQNLGQKKHAFLNYFHPKSLRVKCINRFESGT